MTNESMQIAEKLDRLAHGSRLEVLENTLRMIEVYAAMDERDIVLTQAALDLPAKPKKPPRRFRRVNTHPPKAEVIVLADRRAELLLDRSAS